MVAWAIRMAPSIVVSAHMSVWGAGTVARDVARDIRKEVVGGSHAKSLEGSEITVLGKALLLDSLLAEGMCV